MIGEWDCPFAVKSNRHDFLTCKALMNEGLDYTRTENAARAFCAHQFKCSCDKKLKNTEKAVECYEYQLAKSKR